ncbi:hypothetical protein BS47DRAFT_1335562 [Hydnum rufescens UP504]|uniref:tripeptidyl-peptidase II n=1 Tax=Hydnum rufescens UP504 TaxID=1448309 RepID=A0A9P6DZT6_9AGAM|nr:hypothetical protein BS47DRAFT_1335562 [Hydnum rufescens UP504]
MVFALLTTLVGFACAVHLPNVVRPGTYFAIKSSAKAPQGWVKYSTPSPHQVITLRIALQQPNFHKLEEELLEISNPANPRWTEHLTKEQVEKLAAPHPTSLLLVDEYLASNGVDMSSVQRSPAKDWLIIDVTVAQAERLLNTEYAVFKHVQSGSEIVRAPSYSLPLYLHDHVDIVQPTDYFGSVHAMVSGVRVEKHTSRISDAVLASPNISLSQIKDLYGVTGYFPPMIPTSKYALTGYLEQYANLADLKQFYALYLPPAVNRTLKVELINGAINSQNASEAGVEANIDVQLGGGISYPIQNIFYSTYGRGQNTNPNISYHDNGNEPYDVFLLTLLKKKNHELPQTISTSYGEHETEVPFSYARRVCSLYAQLGSRGISVLHSSGDGGSDGCTNPNVFVPIFPASCPYVTAVGGTFRIPEIAAPFSGGGFSNYFQRPSYQSLAVLSYLRKLGKTYHGFFNASGRGFPDVSAQSAHVEIVWIRRVVAASGTSVSSPIFGAIIALLNNALMADGRRPLGFLNPWLYSLEDGILNDITAGSNPGCGSNGFNATVGWDPVTGLGTPYLCRLLEALGLEGNRLSA